MIRVSHVACVCHVVQCFDCCETTGIWCVLGRLCVWPFIFKAACNSGGVPLYLGCHQYVNFGSSRVVCSISTEWEWTITIGSYSHDKNTKQCQCHICCCGDFLSFCGYTDLTFGWTVLFTGQTMFCRGGKKGLWQHLNHSWYCLVLSRLRCCFCAVWPAPTNLLFHQRWQNYYAYLRRVEDLLAQQSLCMLWQPVALLAAEVSFFLLYSSFSLISLASFFFTLQKVISLVSAVCGIMTG